MNILPYWLAHLVGDYLIQNDYVAARKRFSSGWCLLHVLGYCIPFFFTGLALWQILAIGVEHFFQDRFGLARLFMKYTDHEAFATGPCAPWSIIVTDNTIHLLFIALVVYTGGWIT